MLSNINYYTTGHTRPLVSSLSAKLFNFNFQSQIIYNRVYGHCLTNRRCTDERECRANYILASYVSAVTFDSRLTTTTRSPFLRNGELTLILINRHPNVSPSFVTEDHPSSPNAQRGLRPEDYTGLPQKASIYTQ